MLTRVNYRAPNCPFKGCQSIKALRVGRHHDTIGHMVLDRNNRATTTQPQVSIEDAIREAQEFADQRYPADWDYYEQVVAKNPPNGKVTVPHKNTGELVLVDLLAITPDEIVEQCGIPDHMREESLMGYRLFLKAQMAYWDRQLLPDTIPLLEDSDN